MTQTADLPTTGRRVREARLTKSWTQEDLARESGLSVPTVARVETGRHEPTVATLRTLAHALGLSLIDLVGSDESSSRPS